MYILVSFLDVTLSGWEGRVTSMPSSTGDQLFTFGTTVGEISGFMEMGLLQNLGLIVEYVEREAGMQELSDFTVELGMLLESSGSIVALGF